MKLLYGIWLGLSLSIIGYSFMTWQFYFVLIPTALLVAFFSQEK
jgi:hypothetical protein